MTGAGTKGVTTGFKKEDDTLGRNVANDEMQWEPPAPLGRFDLPPFPLEAFRGN